MNNYDKLCSNEEMFNYIMSEIESIYFLGEGNHLSANHVETFLKGLICEWGDFYPEQLQGYVDEVLKQLNNYQGQDVIVLNDGEVEIIVETVFNWFEDELLAVFDFINSP